MRRRDEIRVEAYGLQGEEIVVESGGLLSICIQHEMDHLNGITFLDRLNSVKRKLVLRSYLAEREASQRSDELDRIADLHGGEDG